MSNADDLEEELYCPICADLFRDPLMLACTHSFCRKCLLQRIDKGLVTRKSSHIMFDCPVCRNEVTLGDNGLDGLPRNRLLKKMVDLHKAKLKQCATENRNVIDSCNEHAKELGAFCSVCREVVCIDCIVGDHKGHPIESVDDVYYKRRKSLERRRSEVEDELNVLSNIESEERKYVDQINEHCKQKSEAIEVQFDEYIGLIQQSKDSVLAEIVARQQEEVKSVQQNLETIQVRKRELSEVLDKFNETLKFDKMKILKDSKLDACARSTAASSSVYTNNEISTAIVGSPRTRCFLECSLELDSVGLESAINNAHLLWEPEADLYSPKHLAGRFTQLYEKEWKSAYLESTVKNKDDLVTSLLNDFMDAFRQAELCCETHLESLTYRMLQPEIDVHVGEYNIHGFNSVDADASDNAPFCNMKEGLRKLRAQHTSNFLQDIVFMTHHNLLQVSSSLGNSNQRQMSLYASKCFEVCFMLRIQDPPLYVSFSSETDPTVENDKDSFKYVKRRGRKTKTLVWPPLYLYRDGPLIAKGVVFVPG